MMKKVPISLLIDDGAPRISVYYEHSPHPFTADGRPIDPQVPNSFLDNFCNVIQKYGIKGKLSVVPMPGGKGDLVSGIEGFENTEVAYWLDKVRTDVAPYFSFSPEMLTHANYLDLKTGKMGDVWENVWSQTQTRETLTPYIAKALDILKRAGIDASGVSSPWNFGCEVEAEHVRAVSEAMYQVFGKTDVWYALHSHPSHPGVRPKLMLDENGRHVVLFYCSVGDLLWQTINNPDTSASYISSVADQLLNADGTGGRIREALDEGSQLIFLTHWQSMYSNGTCTGLRALELVAERIEKNLSDVVEWTTVEDMMKAAIAEA